MFCPCYYCCNNKHQNALKSRCLVWNEITTKYLYNSFDESILHVMLVTMVLFAYGIRKRKKWNLNDLCLCNFNLCLLLQKRWDSLFAIAMAVVLQCVFLNERNFQNKLASASSFRQSAKNLDKNCWVKEKYFPCPFQSQVFCFIQQYFSLRSGWSIIMLTYVLIFKDEHKKLQRMNTYLQI